MISIPFNNRKVCSIAVNYDLEDVINRINEQSFFIRYDGDYELNNKIDILRNYNNDNLNFYYCRFGFEMMKTRTIPEIREEGIVDVDETVIISHALPFWIADNGLILFTSLGNTYNKKGKALLSNHLFDNEESIVECNFNIDAITDAVEEGILNNMWTSSFSGRLNNIQGGVFNGDNVNEDVMFNLADDAIKTSVGIEYEIFDPEVKLRFYESGSVQLLTTELEVDDPTMFNILMDFEEYLIR